ncbi:MAG: FkbM family methyltransferase [Caldilineaceae bacterium]|nr:FkbM family methyltransferase [Caldilineaceae bacterium]
MNMLQNVTRRVLRKARRTIHQWTSPPLDPMAKYAHVSYGSQGEDHLLRSLFSIKVPGFYVDVGAFHPVHLSSTYIFYKRGWRGINIDARPGSMAEFERVRPKDTNLELAIANRRGTSTYYMYEGDEALNTLDEHWVKNLPPSLAKFQLSGKIEVQTYRLADILDRYLPAGQVISFMNVDVEGLDLDVLQSNNWDRYRPRVVLVEQLGIHSLDALQDDPITKYMTGLAYTFIVKTLNTVFYAACEQPFEWYRPNAC